MPRYSFYQAAQLERRLWTPREIQPALAGWWDAADSGTITLVSSAVSAWADKSGKGLNLSQGTSGNRPTYTVGQSVDFAGSQWLETGSWSSGTETEHTFIAVYTATVASNGTFALSLGGGTGTGQSTGAHGPWNDGNIYWDVEEFASTRRVSVAWGGTANARHIWSYVKSTTRNDQVIRRDGNQLAAAGASFQTERISGGIGIGRYVGLTHVGSFCEALVMREGRQWVVDRVEGYLAHKWGLTARLSAAHPFKNRPPTIGG